MKYILLTYILASSLFAGNLVLTGTVISNNKKMIPARYMGYVKKVNFEVGDKVEREDILFELESAEFDMMEAQADLALAQARLMLESFQSRARRTHKDRDNLKRQRTQFNKQDFDFKMVEMSEMADNADRAMESAQVLVEQTSEKAKQFASIAGYLKVLAPNNGILVDKRVQVGDMVAPGMLTMVIVDMEHLEIQAEVAESDLKFVRKNKVVKISIPSLDYKSSGYIKAIVPSANPMAHTFKIRIHFEKTMEEIFPGMYAKVFVDLTDETKR
ncbi:efflux RND transporter periplasmic adaptor subunit [Sulfurimonas sp. SAG-AH-194-I05]|nr:efflux RND transporter periplasmic adaptor subunit [Sulfurimonas sp. SAG-AH-194-I05]MDF1875162.1 efflux RND transporter periplasmic adaptor subunit [Sulfurimonas sp. SAG-AH-194-I05]